MPGNNLATSHYPFKGEDDLQPLIKTNYFSKGLRKLLAQRPDGLKSYKPEFVLKQVSLNDIANLIYYVNYAADLLEDFGLSSNLSNTDVMKALECVCFYYGIFGYQKLTLTEIGKNTNLFKNANSNHVRRKINLGLGVIAAFGIALIEMKDFYKEFNNPTRQQIYQPTNIYQES